MQKIKPVSYLIDFDSTFIKSEGLEALAAVSLQNNVQRESIIEEIKNLTSRAMEGTMPFAQSLSKRVKLLQSNKSHIAMLEKSLKNEISSSITRNKKFFTDNSDRIYIISGGFKELILPVIKNFGIKPQHVFANTFVYDEDGNIIGIDENNPMSKNGGKVQVVTNLKLSNDLYIIGDGYTDYELKKLGLAKKFIAFTENITRDSVVSKADEVAVSFDEFLFVNKLPRSLSYPKNRISVLLLTEIPKTDLDLFFKEGYQITDYRNVKNPEEIINHLNKAAIICVDQSNEALLKQIPDTHFPLAIGYYAVDKPQSTNLSERGVAVFYKQHIAKKIISYSNSGNTHQCVTIPNLKLPQHKNVHRLLHTHKNVPGILAQINNTLAKHKINILGQYLKTNQQIGYVIIDVDREYDRKVLSALKKIPQTIRFRVLY
ncbi:MAG: HAD-IB family phosphatase [Candidatus Levybacteria bacterium]|nr:HAD-IB family phosphatase [Candidatus Levybacteria bacterium]